MVDNHPPTVTLDDPGAAVGGTVALTTTTSADTTQVTFERSPAGAGTWTTIAVDSTSPFGASLDTTPLADGLYDLRAVATDGANVVDSNVRTTRFDNTPPTGSVTAPASGATVGGPSVTLTANAADGGSGVATVEFRVDGSSVGTASSAPWTLAWNPSSTPSGGHAVDAIITDAAGNTHITPAVPITVDSTPPTVTLTDPGALLSGAVTLHASSLDADTARVDFQISPAGANTWTAVASDTTPPTPYSGALDTTTVADGLYDLRAIAHDAVGNVSTPSVVASRRIDNTPPSFVSATPADGSTIAAASSIAVTASESLSAVTGATLDGAATVAPTIAGATATYATGALGDGPHTLAGTLVDLAGKTTPFTTHFTIVSGPPPADWPYVEMNAFPGVPATLASTDGGATVSTHSAVPSSTDHRRRADRSERAGRRRRRFRDGNARVRRHLLLVADRRAAALVLLAARDRHLQPDERSEPRAGDVRERRVAADPRRPDCGHPPGGLERRLFLRRGRDPHPHHAPHPVHAAARPIPAAAAARRQRHRRAATV